MGRAHWGKGQSRQRASESYWNDPFRWNRKAAKAGIRYRVFCSALSDWLDDEVPVQWRADLLNVVRQTPHLDWLLLSKRPQNWRRLLTEVMDLPGNLELSLWVGAWLNGTPPANAWIGASVEDQIRADQRIPELLKIPAVVRFLSIEPLLGPIDLLRVDAKGFGGSAGHKVDCIRKGFWSKNWGFVNHSDMHDTFGSLDWVIVGGESGPQARPMHPDWVRSLRDQCKEASVPFHFKQWGVWLPWDHWALDLPNHSPASRVATYPTMVWNDLFWESAGSEEAQENEAKDLVSKISKKAAGWVLDGKEHQEFPKCSNLHAA